MNSKVYWIWYALFFEPLTSLEAFKRGIQSIKQERLFVPERCFFLFFEIAAPAAAVFDTILLLVFLGS
jgi:hypothetical protein